mgnify:CR=1 FL=1
MYGTQTFALCVKEKLLFENDVKMYGTQTKTAGKVFNYVFENDVKMYGTQTFQTCAYLML